MIATSYDVITMAYRPGPANAPDPKALCRDLQVQISGATKAQLVGRLLPQWQLGLFVEDGGNSEMVGHRS